MFSGWSGKFRNITIYLMYFCIFAVGDILCTLGIGFAIWFIFISEGNYRYFWGAVSISLIILGYVLMRLFWPHVRSHWDDYL